MGEHADWVQRNIAAHQKRKPTKRERDAADGGKGWYAAPGVLNEFQRGTFDILGNIARGIYNAPIVWRSVEWSPRFIVVVWCGELASFDFDQLTRLVFLAHDKGIRVAVAAKAHRYLEITFHYRERDGDVSRSHPTLDAALTGWRERHPVPASFSQERG